MIELKRIETIWTEDLSENIQKEILIWIGHVNRRTWSTDCTEDGVMIARKMEY